MDTNLNGELDLVEFQSVFIMTKCFRLIQDQPLLKLKTCAACIELELDKLIQMRNEIGLTYYSGMEPGGRRQDIERWHKIAWRHYMDIDQESAI